MLFIAGSIVLGVVLANTLSNNAADQPITLTADELAVTVQSEIAQTEVDLDLAAPRFGSALHFHPYYRNMYPCIDL